jgi:hypothetical protein
VEADRRSALVPHVCRPGARRQGSVSAGVVPPVVTSGRADPQEEERMVGYHAASEADVVLVGAGIMSATLATILKELQPSLAVEVFEVLDGPAQDSYNYPIKKPTRGYAIHGQDADGPNGASLIFGPATLHSRKLQDNLKSPLFGPAESAHSSEGIGCDVAA